jgi:hypothetical protein
MPTAVAFAKICGIVVCPIFSHIFMSYSGWRIKAENATILPLSPTAAASNVSEVETIT